MVCTIHLTSLHSKSFLKPLYVWQHPISSILGEEDEDFSEFSEQKYYGQERSLGENASRSSQMKKLLPNRSLSSSTPRTPVAPVPRSTAKISNSGSARRRPQSENPLAQSVPIFSDLRKENTKPLSGVSKVTSRSQGRNYGRSKSSTEDMKEEKPKRSTSLRKSSAGPAEFLDLPSSDDVVLAPLKFDLEANEQGLHGKFSRSLESKSFLRKGNGLGGGGGIPKLKASVAAETLRNEEEDEEEEYDESAFEAEDAADIAKEDEELETMEIEDSTEMGHGEPRLSREFDKVGNSGSENGDSMRSISQIDPGSVAELPAALPSPGESPVSWNSRMHHPFSYPQENSDIDASLDSPIGSPASWNSHSLSQTEVDAARMRKKWGSAYKPFIASNSSSHNQSRKDVTKGFKRLLKFGRKNRGTDSLADWISATTSEGDDDTEDGRDIANRSSEDLRKSRMGFSQNHPSDDAFNESELFNEHGKNLSNLPFIWSACFLIAFLPFKYTVNTKKKK